MTLMLYLSRLVATYVLASTIVLLLLGLSLDMLKSATDLLAEGGAMALVIYAALRAPLIAATLFPIAVLTGGVLAFLALARRSEIVVIRAVGLSAFGMLRLLAPCAILLGLAYHLMGDRVAPWAEARLSDRFPVSTDAAETGSELWSRIPGEIAHAVLANTDGTELTDLTFWYLDADGQVLSRASAQSARFIDDVWTLTGYNGNPANDQPEAGERRWKTQLKPATVRALAAGTLAVSTATARGALAGAEIPTRGEAYYRTLIAQSYVALVIPAVMLLLAAAASFDKTRGGATVERSILAVVAGFIYIVLDGVLGTLSEVGAVNALLAAILPTALFATLGVWGLILLEEK